MARRHMTRRMAALAACLAALVMGGCGTANQVTFTNVSETWLNVRFFVSSSPTANQLTSRQRFQVKPGETARFSIHRRTRRGVSSLVHMQVQPIQPSWEGPGKQYWMELLTDGAVKIVARGKGSKIDFEVGDGEIARIPSRQLKKRFDYRIAGAPEVTTP